MHTHAPYAKTRPLIRRSFREAVLKTSNPHLQNRIDPLDMPRVAYYFDDDIGAYAFAPHHPMKPHRIKMAHNLILNAGLNNKMDMLTAKRATREEMTRFHTDEYINHIAQINLDDPETLASGRDKSGENRFLVGDDCPGFEGLFEFCSISAGGSIAAARRINAGQADIAINWAGGLHHAKKREASGFCYINDIVLAILELLRFHSRVLYIDIDIHHGDGVEEAFYTTDRVLTCSFHKFGDFFPGTGHVGDRGIGRGKGYAVNVPLKTGIDDETYRSIFRPVVNHIMSWYHPGAIVLQCGADSLAEDKLGSFNLSMNGHAECVRYVKSFNIPLIVLGGGGYTIRNVARTWAFETSVCLGPSEEMSTSDLPYNEYMEYFGPNFKLDVPCNNMDNQNSIEYLNGILATVVDHLRDLPFSPSVHQRPLSCFPEANSGNDTDDSDLTDMPEGPVTTVSSTNNAGEGQNAEPPPPPPPQPHHPNRVGRPSRLKPPPAPRRVSPRLADTTETLNPTVPPKDTNTLSVNQAGNERKKRIFFRNCSFDRPARGDHLSSTRLHGLDGIRTRIKSSTTCHQSSHRLPLDQSTVYASTTDRLRETVNGTDEECTNIEAIQALNKPKEIVLSWDWDHCF
ncbi:hypothetical protein O181_046503 [Austropuccinia psidii MF-1]|uniref:histone deacetylase n=1 Tax=Austropuccinia psidii MF-1 TaxID=1389203 RepID=A0A9Q3DU77_9BASI|nr:hypothetical protein [Austropuccinia psidii MF-1]